MMVERLTALYLIAAGPDGPTKVGISSDPEARLSSLQSSHPHRLFIWGKFWFRSRSKAVAAEKWILENYCKSARLQGEWVSTGARQLSPTLVGLLSITFGHRCLEEWEECFTKGDNKVWPELLTDSCDEAAEFLSFGA
jgi:hypothetical protein